MPCILFDTTEIIEEVSDTITSITTTIRLYASSDTPGGTETANSGSFTISGSNLVTVNGFTNDITWEKNVQDLSSGGIADTATAVYVYSKGSMGTNSLILWNGNGTFSGGEQYAVTTKNSPLADFTTSDAVSINLNSFIGTGKQLLFGFDGDDAQPDSPYYFFTQVSSVCFAPQSKIPKLTSVLNLQVDDVIQTHAGNFSLANLLKIKPEQMDKVEFIRKCCAVNVNEQFDLSNLKLIKYEENAEDKDD